MTQSYVLGLLTFVTLPWLSGFLVVAALWNRRLHPGFLVKLFLAPGVGYGLSSVFTYIWFSLFPSIRSDFPLEDVAFHCLLIGICTLYLFANYSAILSPAIATFTKQMDWQWRVKQATTQLLHSKQWLTLVLLIGFGLMFIVSAISAINHSMDVPYGEWDAWQTWNYRARVLYRGENFALNFLPFGHFDYPMLLPLNVIRGWQYIGAETQVVPIVLALTFLFASIGLLFSVIVVFNSIRQAALAGLILLGTARYWQWGVSQYADVPLAYYGLGIAVVLYTLGQQRTSVDINVRGRALLLGILVGLCVWTKNEGVFWLAAVMLVLVWQHQHKSAIPQLVMLAALPILAVVFSLKFNATETNDILAGQSLATTVERLFSLSRYATIYYAVLGSLTGYFLWFFVALIVMAQPRAAVFSNGLTSAKNKGQSRILGVLFLVLMAYELTYVITPQNLQWHLETSLDRLLIHVWPAFLFAVFVAASDPLTQIEH